MGGAFVSCLDQSFYDPEGSSPDKLIFKALVLIQQLDQLSAVVLYSFKAIVWNKSCLLPRSSLMCQTQGPRSVLLMSRSFLKCPFLTSHLPVCFFRSYPPRRSKLRACLHPHPMPRSPARRSPARVRTCPATRSRHLHCQQPALDPWPQVQSRLRFQSTDIRAGPRTRRAALNGMRLHSASASYPMTPPSGMWQKFMSSSDHCQVRGVNTEYVGSGDVPQNISL